ncbi:MAG TPA: T9SS type A sorting domain-containing protein [Ignavibacteria bacterium]
MDIVIVLGLIKGINNKKLIYSIAVSVLFFCLFNNGFTQPYGYDYGTNTGSVSSGTGTHLLGATFFPAPTGSQNVSFFYGFSTNANATLIAANPGLLQLGTYTEAQASAGNGPNEFCKFGVMEYATANLKTAYNKFEVILGGNTGTNTSSTGIWYFFAGDGGKSSSKFLYNNTVAKNLLTTAAAIRWTFGSNGTLTADYYSYISTTTGEWKTLPGTYIQTVKYFYEIYSNTATTTTYLKNGTTYTCDINKMDIWVNNVLVAQQVNVGSTNSALLKIDSWCFYGEGSNTAYIFTDQVTYSGNINGILPIDYYSKSTGNLDVLGTWGINSDGSGTSPSDFISNLCTYNIRNNSAPTLGAAWTVSGLDSKVILGDGTNACNFTIPSNYIFNGVTDISNNGTLTLRNLTPPAFGQLLNGSTVDYGYTGTQNISYPFFYNLKTSGTGTKILTTNVTATNNITVGDNTNAGTLLIPSSYTLTGTTNVSNNGTLSIQNTTNPTFGTLSAGSTVEYAHPSTSQITPSTAVIFDKLVINNANGVSLGGSTSVNNMLTLTNGTLNTGSQTLTFTNGNTPITRTNGTITTSTGTNLIFGTTGNTGGNAFTIPSGTFSSTPSINNFTLNRTSSLTLSQDLNINGTLTLTAGLLIGRNGSTDYITTLGSSTSSIGTLFVGTGRIVGMMKRYISTSTTNYLFPIGTISNYNGINLCYTSGPSVGGILTAKFTLGDPGSMNGNNPIIDISTNPNYIINLYSIYGYWSIVESGVAGTYRINLNADGFPGISADADKRGQIRILKRENNGTLWTATGDHLTATGTQQNLVAERENLSSFSEYALGTNSEDNTFEESLPVLLLTFSSSLNGRDIKLNWITSSELNNAGFDVERAEMGNQNLEFGKIGFVQGRGTISTPTNYLYTDSKLNTGKYKYRLKQIDNNGNFEYHDLQSFVEIGVPAKFDLSQNYPNPFNPVTKIDFTLPFESKVKVVVYDITGKEMKIILNDSKAAGYYSLRFDASNFASGVYFYRINAKSNEKDFSSIKKMLLIK